MTNINTKQKLNSSCIYDTNTSIKSLKQNYLFPKDWLYTPLMQARSGMIIVYPVMQKHLCSDVSQEVKLSTQSPIALHNPHVPLTEMDIIQVSNRDHP